MKKLLLTLLVSSLTGSFAYAGSKFVGHYQLKNAAGKVIFQSALKLERVNVAGNKALHVYTEPTNKGPQSTICDFEITLNSDGNREYSEKCDDYGDSSLKCKNGVCIGTMKYDDIKDPAWIVEVNTSKVRKQTATLKKPINIQGLKGVKSYEHTLRKVD